MTLNKEEYIKKAEEIIGHDPDCDKWVWEVLPRKQKNRWVFHEEKECDCHLKETLEALYQLHIEGVREIIGEDEETDPDKLTHYEANELLDQIEARNMLREEQREKLKK